MVLTQAPWMTNPEKILFPKSGITKAALADYYEAIAPLMVPFMRNHLLAMQRFPNGIDQEGFYQKDIPDYFPEWIKRVPIENRNGTTTTYVICQNQKTLVYLAYQACITPHLWLSCFDKPNYPDRMIFDLDPGEHTSFDMIKKTALRVKEFLESHGITAFAMTTGSRGMHIIAPLKRLYSFEFVHAYAQEIAQRIVSKDPQNLTIDIRKEARRGKLFIDFLRNTYAHHAVSPYAVRPYEKAPIATPLAWNELSQRTLQSQSYNISNIHKRIEAAGDVWPSFFKIKNTLAKL